jgi:hypothetical protein
MARSRRLLGQVLLVLAVMAAGFVGAKLGLLGTRDVAASHNFNDVPPGAFYHDFVDYLAQSGITAGCGPGQFCGEQAVTRGQMAVFLGLLRLVAGCPPDSVRVGSICLDKYEASVWEVPPANVPLIRKIRLGTVTLAELQAGATQRGAPNDDYGAACVDSGVGCVNLYAVSIAGVTPSRHLTWFQATAAARNAGKRLPTNVEWQAAALGTPDGAPCVVASGSPGGPTGSVGCVSNAGVFDMVGNLSEWVADWILLPGSPACDAAFYGTNDFNCLAGLLPGSGPGAILRGGNFQDGTGAGAFAVGSITPTFESDSLGFRGVR